MIVEEYLERLKYQGDLKVNAETLNNLHKVHVLAVPFEVLDIHMQVPISLEIESIYQKVIHRNRGGFCYELNYLFYNLLMHLGFDCIIVSSRIINDDVLGPEFDHMSLIVKLKENWLVDVGYGNLFIEPIKIVDGTVHRDWFKSYTITYTSDSKCLLSESKDGLEFVKRYEFDQFPRKIEDFYPQNQIKQYSKESYFVKNKICTLPTQDGRKTLWNNKFITNYGNLRSEVDIGDLSKYHEILKNDFGIIFGFGI